MKLGGFILSKENKDEIKLYQYFSEWVEIYKVGAVKKVTLNKYRTTEKRLKEIAPDINIVQLNKRKYQEILNIYAKTHERQTVMDFHHQIKSSILDAMDEGIIDKDPTRKAIIKGKTPLNDKTKYLNKHELVKVLSILDLSSRCNYDWVIYFIAKTGVRFSEAIAVTVDDIDFDNHTVSINKTWNYKDKKSKFAATKNLSSKRILKLDQYTINKLKKQVHNLPKTNLLFIDEDKRIHNANYNNHLKKLCENICIPAVTLHALRHTHASLLLFQGVSIASVAKRLGHSNMATTQRIYLHIIQELESQDNSLLLSFLADLDHE